jgi:hypothetical protein
MAVLAVIIPILMLGVVLALGRYEELLLPSGREKEDRQALEPPAPPPPPLTVRGVTSRDAAGTPAPSP